MGDLYLVQMGFDAREAFRGGQVSRGAVDVGYLAHCRLTALFGELAPKPFALQVGRDGVVSGLLGYATEGREALIEHARQRVGPANGEALSRGLAVKKMPAEIPVGKRLGFEVRVCPVVRLASDRPESGKGSERDVYQREAWEAERRGEVFLEGREEVYRRWLAGRLAGAAELSEARMVRFEQRERLFRQTQGDGRTGKMLERPDLVFRGTLVVADSGAFGQVLARGVGRHRAFGFGMLLVRPPEG